MTREINPLVRAEFSGSLMQTGRSHAIKGATLVGFEGSEPRSLLEGSMQGSLERIVAAIARQLTMARILSFLLVVALGCAESALSHDSGESLDPADWSVFIQTRDGSETRRNRIWIVEMEGQLYIRTGSTRWHDDVKRDPRVAIEAGHGRHVFRVAAIVDPEKHDQIMQAFRAKYGWMDRLIHRMRGTTFRLETLAAEEDRDGRSVSPENPRGSAS